MIIKLKVIYPYNFNITVTSHDEVPLKKITYKHIIKRRKQTNRKKKKRCRLWVMKTTVGWPSYCHIHRKR